MIKVRQIKIKVEEDNKDNLLKAISKKIHINSSDIKDYKIIKKSIDARNKNEIFFVYEVNVNTDKSVKYNNDVFEAENEEYILPECGYEKLNNRVVIVGSGPSGLFCAYTLCLKGFKPLIIERGESVEDRVKTVNEFWSKGKLNPKSNVQFGEGGAGTFSDGKLNTLIKDTNNRMRFVFETFVENGASEEILYSYKPHIGTDVLVNVVMSLREKIKSFGGEFLFNTCLTNINTVDDKLESIEINNKETIKTDVLVLAIGHSSRDTFRMLFRSNLSMKSKPFAVGYRIIHNQSMIDESQYGKKYASLLSPANYKLTFKSMTGRGVYSFCMCPGGYVVNSSSEEGHLVVNGMSNHLRDSKWANSAIIVTINEKDYGVTPLSGVEFQEELETKAYKMCDGKIPVQLFVDFLHNEKSTSVRSVKPEFKGKYAFANLNELLPEFLNNAIKEGIISFGKKIKGFNDVDSVLAGVESRTSSPIKIYRNEEFVSNIKGIYPSGEGAGYSGGITSSAIDGIKVAEAIIKKYKMD